MHCSDSASGKRRQHDNDERSERSTPPRPPLPSSSFSMPLSVYSGESSSPTTTIGSSKVVRRMTRTRSSPTPLGQDVSEEDEDRRDSHDLSISPRAFGRESLVDNLLLSFDKFGNGDLGFDSAFFSPTNELDDDDAATTSSQHTGYSTRGRRSNSSSNYHSHLGRLPTHSSGGSRAFGSVDYGTVPAGFGLGYSREAFSRGGTAASILNGFVNTEYDPAPTPTVHSGPRDRSVTIESAGKIERRGSIKSTRSSRRLQDHHVEEKMPLPPMPAFHTPAAPVPATPVKQSKAPGFFRRVFGGGISSSSSNNKGKAQQIETVDQKIVQSPQQQDGPAEIIPPATINKKPSFFRRRKKSMSEASPQSAPPLPVQPARDEHQFDQAEPSPISSLRAVMNPYLRTPAVPASPDLEFEPEPSYSPYNATIRTVPQTDPGSPPQRPTFFGESRARRDSETHFASSSSPNLAKTARYSKDSKLGKAHSSELTLDTPTPTKKSVKEDRPQTSPHSPLSLPLTPTEDTMWLPPFLGIRKSMDNMAIDREKQREMDASNSGRGPSTVAQEKPIATVKDIELQHAQLEQKRRESRGSGPLNVDVNVDAFTETSRIGSSWLATPTPLSGGSSAAVTPTVMLQVEASGDINDTESEPADLSELLGGDEATDNEKMFVKKIFDGDEEFVTKARAAAWLGTSTPAAERARRAYMAMFDFSNMNILSAVRMLCGKLVLKGETQQVDRIVDAFSKRWCECNPNHGFKSADVVHTILYSLLLLNTDLHMVDVPSSQKMTRGQFLKNTMATIRRGLADVPGTPLEARPAHHTLPNRSSALLTAGEALQLTGAALTFPLAKEKTVEPRSSLDFGRSNRNSTMPGGIGNISPRFPDDISLDYAMDGGLALVNAPISGGIRMWETQVEIILKDFYTSIKATALPLHGASKEKVNETNAHNGGALSVFGSSMLRRSPSTISKAGSERNDSSSRLNTKWTAKNRSRPKLYNGSYAGSSRTSLEDRSLWSPSASSTWSKYSLDKTQTSMSVTSLGSVFGHADYQQSIGFANALSHAIIREEASGTTADEVSSAHLEDDGLELLGAPWAKEGMIKHKHHLEGLDKRAKNRVWTECFAVITKGSLKMFLFNTGKSAHSGGVVGGGNWTENAQPIGTFLLRHTIASALPSPGYSKTRPHVWALSLPNGAVHLFQAGTEEIIKEWVTTANYWSARLSKEPLVGGVSNVEYGWGECIADIETTSTTATFGPRPSLQESIRSSIDHGSMVRPRLPGDKIVIAEWTPPGQSMMASPLSEADQLKALETYVANINMELARHNDLRGAMTLAFSPRHPNHTKALANWERKSSYLLKEIVKFRTYIDSLTAAIAARDMLREEERNRETMSVMTT